jgi:hypothetical protein
MTRLATFAAGIDYGQIAVFDSRLDRPFNDWTDRHVKQGYTWRPGSVSFSPVIHSGLAAVAVNLSNSFRRSKLSKRVIAVPFEITERMPVEIGSVFTASGAHVFDLEPGTYRLYFESGPKGEDDCWVRFTFVPDPDATHEVLLADSRLSPTYPLLTEAVPA